MSEAFLKVVNMSISAGWLVLAVLALRLILKKAPKWVNVLLWGIVAIRLICPFSIESALSLIPSRETISPEIMMDWTPEISTGIAPLDQAVNPVISTSFAPSPGASANPLQILIPVAANLWLLGMIIMLAYTAISYLSLRRKLRTAVILRDNIFQCETVSSPFVLGILKPRIYLPYNMNGQNLHHVVAHEQAHIRRKDHWWKPLGFLLLTVYWFNPLMWVAYILLCRDIELACDEKVIAELGSEQRADYTQALVACAVNRRMIAACPLAFGEVGVKDRIKSIMNYRKPTFWIIVAALVVCVLVAVCFLTNPIDGSNTLMSGEYIISDMLYSHAPSNEENFVPSDSYSVSTDFELYERNADGEWVSLGAMEEYPLTNKELYSYNLEGWHRHYPVRKITDAYILRVEDDFFYFIFQTQDGKTYLAYGWEDMGERGQPGSDDTGLRRLYQLEPAANSGVTKWFDYTTDPSAMSYEEELKIQLDEFPDTTFIYTPYDIIATTSWEDSNTAGKTFLISGLPIWNAYFCDLTGDGLPEICSQVSYGSGIIDSRVIIFDYANGVSYKLEDRGYHDYYLRMEEGWLYVDKWDYNSNLLVSSGRLVFKDGCIQIEGVSSEPQELPTDDSTKMESLQEIAENYVSTVLGLDAQDCTVGPRLAAYGLGENGPEVIAYEMYSVFCGGKVVAFATYAITDTGEPTAGCGAEFAEAFWAEYSKSPDREIAIVYAREGAYLVREGDAPVLLHSMPLSYWAPIAELEVYPDSLVYGSLIQENTQQELCGYPKADQPDRILIRHSDFPGTLAKITGENPEVLNEILSMYDSLELEEYGRPLSEERLVLTFYRGEDIIQEWTVSYYSEDDTVVTCSDGFGLGNRRVISDFSYDRLQRIFEDYAFTMIFCYEPLGVSGDNVEELSRISDHVKWIDGLGIDELAPGEEIVSDFVIDVEDGTDLLIMITWGRQPLVLKYGIRAEDGTEFFQEKSGGSSMLRMKDIPAGTYRLFVRNSEAYAGIPAYENPEKFPDVSFNATGAILYAFDN